MLYIMVFNIIQMNSMLASLSAAGALVGVAWGYLSKLTFFTGAKYYVSQQLAQMQVHHYNKKSIIIPRGFAHGFQALEDNCIILYIHSNSYQKKFESGLNVLDKKLNVKWPIKINKISKRDRRFKYINDNFKGLNIE